MSLARSLFHSFSEKYINLIVQLLTSVLVARILSPEDFGIYAISFFILLIANILRESGISSYIVKEKELSQTKIDTCFVILMSVSFITFIVITLTAGRIADFYAEPQLKLVLQILAVNILISSFGSINTAQLHRALRFKGIAISSIVSNISGSVATILLAVYLGGPEVLALGALITTVTYPIFLYFLEREFLEWKVRFKFKLREARSIFSYSKFVLASTLIFELANSLAQMIIGKTHSMSQVGLYNRAVTTGGLLNKLLTEGLSPVITPFFSSINRAQENLTSPYYTLTNIFNYISWPFFTFVFFHSNEIITLIFGEQWKSAGIFLQIICIDRILGTFAPMFDPVFLGLGKAKQLMNLNLCLNTLKICVIVSTIHYGIDIMLLAVSTSIPLLGSIVRVWLLAQNNLITYKGIFIANSRPFVVAISIAICLNLFKESSDFDIIELVLSALLCFFIFLVFLINSELLKIIRTLMEKKA